MCVVSSGQSTKSALLKKQNEYEAERGEHLSVNLPEEFI